MTTVKNMAYWRSKNKCDSKGSYDGGLPKLKAKRSPMRQNDEQEKSEQEKHDEHLGKGIFNKPKDD